MHHVRAGPITPNHHRGYTQRSLIPTASSVSPSLSTMRLPETPAALISIPPAPFLPSPHMFTQTLPTTATTTAAQDHRHHLLK
jgi:hypothetical protein